jgi:hypothetical protein
MPMTPPSTVHGLAGTGKTRLVVEALGVDGIRDRVLYAASSEGLHTFVARIVRDERTRGILVVDELDEADRNAIYQRFAATRGRWRLLAIVPQATPRLRAAGVRDVVLAPLSEAATRRLIASTSGLPEWQASTVANVARGFPELAFRLAEEWIMDSSLDLVQLAHLDRPNDVLRRALPDDQLRAELGPLSLFTGLGVDGDLAYQLEEVAAGFGHDVEKMRRIIEVELSRRRFVSAAGRYRLVSPTLMAIWLAIELIDETPALDTIISGLSQPVQDAFFAQLELFGPQADQLAPALERLLQERRFRDPEAFDEAAGRFLRASAAVVPSQVAEAVQSLLALSSEREIALLPRRDLVWTLQILLWWPTTWDGAIQGLFRLAQHETETWSNNASGQFKDAFAVWLSGSTVPFEHRIRWLKDAIAEARTADLPLLGDAAAAGLHRHHHRTVVGFRGGGEPDDWKPETVGEVRSARAAAWEALIGVLDRSPQEMRAEFVGKLGNAITTMALDGLLHQVDASLRSRSWSPSERAELFGDVNRLLRLGDLTEQVRAELTRLAEWLEGESEDRLDVLLATPVWELHDDRTRLNDDPQQLVAIAERLSGQPHGLEIALAAGGDGANSNTRYRFLRLMAQRVGAARLVDAARRHPPDTVAYAAAFSVADSQGEGAWVDETVARLGLEYPAQLPGLVVYAGVSANRLATTLELVEAGRAPVGPLVNLRGGALFLNLPSRIVQRLFRALADAREFEGALGMALQWMESDLAVPPWVADWTFAVTQEALKEPQSDSMVEYYIKEFVRRGIYDAEKTVALWELRMRTRDGLIDELDDILTDRVLTTAASALLPRVVRLIKDEASGDASFSLFVSRDLALLSRLANSLGVDPVWEALSNLDEHQFRIALHHMSWSGMEPDPLVSRFLSARLDGYESEAFTTFFNTLGTVMGSYWRALEGECARAASWLAALEDPGARRWAKELVQRYERDIEWQRSREEEEDFRLGR